MRKKNLILIITWNKAPNRNQRYKNYFYKTEHNTTFSANIGYSFSDFIFKFFKYVFLSFPHTQYFLSRIPASVLNEK